MAVSHAGRVMPLKRTLRDRIARALTRPPLLGIVSDPRYFQLWEKRGWHVTRNHFYHPIPDTGTLSEEVWSKPSELVGIDMRDDDQSALAKRLALQFGPEYRSFPVEKPAAAHEYYVRNPMFGRLDGDMLYCMVRDRKPARLIEIGSGISTRLSARAVLKNADEGAPCSFVAYEPYPKESLKYGMPGLTRLAAVKAQDIPLAEFAQLQENDILFIDSSHVLKIGSDVQYEFLEVLPRLQPGVIIHVHDIFWPFEYPRDWVVKRQRFWNEQYLLQAFLAFNQSFEILWASAYMLRRHLDVVKDAFPLATQDDVWAGSSIWIRKTA